MINLIPPEARQIVMREYWLRVITVWIWLFATALFIVAILNFPTYVLVNSQLRVFNEQYTEAQLKQDEFQRLETDITLTNAVATHLAQQSSSTPASTYLDKLDQLARGGIEIMSVTFNVTENAVESIDVVGVAADRAALTFFSDTVEADALFVEAKIPIANLAKDKDITFNVTVAINPDTV